MRNNCLKTILAALLLLCCTVASAHDFEVDGVYYNVLSEEDKTVAVTYSGSSSGAVADEYSGIVTIPSTVTYNDVTYRVTSIGNSAFHNCSSLTSIEIPNSVTTIGESAFNNCTGLTSVTIPNSVTSIGYRAFYYCPGLKSVTIPNSVTTIGNDAFKGCTGLKSIVVDAGNSVYDSREGCNAIIETATNTLIAGCKNTIIPGSVISIGDYAFYNCRGLTSITIPNSVTTIGDYAFNDCTLLTSVTIGNSVTKIGDSAFSSCPNLKSVTIGNSVTTIGSEAFSNCTGLTSVEIPNSVTTIGNHAFSNCPGLTSIEIPNSVTSIGNYAFHGCRGLKSITIPNSVTTIGESAFRGCTGLTSVTIGNSVTKIGDSAFYNCSGLTAVHISDLSAWCKIDFYGYYSNPLYYAKKLYLNGEEVTNLVIPADVTEIKDYAFYNCSSLTEIYVKATTPPTIASNTFYNCSSATLYVPAGSKAAYLSADYWKRFTNIEEIIIPGDINGDIIVDVADVTMLVSAILNGEGAEETPTEQTFEDWTSTNAGVGGSTSQSSYTLEAAEGSVLTFDWSVSSESNYDWLTITLDDTQILRKSGSYTGSYEHTFTAAGTHTLVAKYTKDGSVNNGSDQGKIYNIKLSGSTSSKNNSTADINGDGTVDVADVTSLVNIILFGNNESDDTAGETIGIPQDLGLSVKWASYNVGAIAAWESGDYYAWGETEEKEEYSQSTYKFSGSSGFGQFTKYYYDNMLGLGGDGKTKLDYEDDVARVKWGGSWRMPTKRELDELRDNCTWEWETLYGVKGYRVTGPNGNSIFLPAVGYRTGTEINSQQKIYYWSSTVYVIGGYTDAYIIDETYAGDDYFFDAVCGRHCGLPVRPVCE